MSFYLLPLDGNLVEKQRLLERWEDAHCPSLGLELACSTQHATVLPYQAQLSINRPSK